MQSFLAAQNYAAILTVILLVVVIRLPIDYTRIMNVTDNDFGTHIYYALDLLHGRSVPSFTLAHSLWQLYLIGMWWLSRSRIDFWQSAIMLQVVSSIVSALIVYFWYGVLPNRPPAWKRAFWAVTLVIVTPVIAPPLLDGAYYFGYIGLANYHNPTVHVLRPLALLMFILAFEVLARPRHSLWITLCSAVLFAAATWLKPSYTIVLLPALGLMVLYWLYRRKPVDWGLLIGGIGLPSVLVLAAQFLITYQVGDEPESGILFLPFVVARSLSGFVVLKFFMSILFPLVIGLALLRWVKRDQHLVLAWLGFGIGAAQFYLLAESGSRLYHANFVWGVQVALFLLFVVTIRFLLKQEYEWKWPRSRVEWLAYAAYLPHVLSGVAYYIFCLVTPHYG